MYNGNAKGKDWRPYAKHILLCMDKIRRIQAKGDIQKDDILYDACLRNLQTLSEATQLLPDALKHQFDEIPWRDISGFRNILVHNYLGTIDPMTVQGVIDRHLPKLEDAVKQMLLVSDGC